MTFSERLQIQVNKALQTGQTSYPYGSRQTTNKPFNYDNYVKVVVKNRSK